MMGKMKMVTKGGKKVPAFAADGVGKMAKGGAVSKKGGDQSMCSPRKQMAMGMKADGAKAPKKMMGGGMAKGYKYGGMAKKGKKAC